MHAEHQNRLPALLRALESSCACDHPDTSDHLLPSIGRLRNGAARMNMRIPIRWRWSVLVGFTVTIAVVALYFIILDIEHDAWLENQDALAKAQVGQLTDALKTSLLSPLDLDTDSVGRNFQKKVPTVLGLIITRKNDGHIFAFGNARARDPILRILTEHQDVQRLASRELWYGQAVTFSKTVVGNVAVHYSERQWENIAGKLKWKISIAAVIAVLLTALPVFWIAGRMSRPIEMLADAAKMVGDGNYQINLPVSGNDELSDALAQFNVMATELAHKEELRDVFGRYLNPKLIKDVFDSGDIEMESHRQHVSVLFADMVRFTSFSESTETEHVISMLNRHFEVFHRIITYYGGHVDKYIGDAVMAVFNHPVEETEHVRHAVLAGLAMSQACQQLDFKRPDGDPIAFRFGINSGQAIVGNIGAAKRLEYTVIGDAVNVASRMGGLGRGGEVVIPKSTFLQLGNGFSFQSIGVKKIKGVSAELEVGHILCADSELMKEIEHVVDLALNLDPSKIPA